MRWTSYKGLLKAGYNLMRDYLSDYAVGNCKARIAVGDDVGEG